MAKEQKPITFILLDESITTYGVRVLVDGVDIKQFKRNPTMYYNHRDYDLPIGRWVNIRKENGQILADAEFDYNDARDEVQELFRKVSEEFIKMASVDLRDIEVSIDPKHMLAGQTEPTIVKSRLREASVVNNGGNHNAFKLFDSKGEEIVLSDQIKLSDIFKPKFEKKMNKETLTALKLSDEATPAEIEAAVKLVLNDNKMLKETNATLLSDKETLQTEKDKLQADLDTIKLKEAEEKKAEFEAELQAAFKDGRLDNDKDGKTKDSWLKLYEVAPEMTLDNLKGLPKKRSAAQKLNDGSTPKGNAFEEREKQINERKKQK